MKKVSICILATAIASPFALTAQDDFDIVAAWEKDCQKCHASDGSGLTKKGRQLRVRDYRSAEVQAEMKDAEMIDAMKVGVVKKGEEVMKGYLDDYTEEEIKAFVAYIRTLAK